MNVLLGITGSVAAVKAPDLVRRLIEKGHTVNCVMTKSAAQFVAPLALATFSKNPVQMDVWGADAYKMPHLELSNAADVMLIAPASATVLGRCARGLAEEMVSLCYITTTAPVLIAPAMHNTMWEHPAVQENVKILQDRGARFVGPQTGALADNTSAVGRMAEIDEIVAAVSRITKKK